MKVANELIQRGPIFMIVEPQCRGFEHAHVNAALIRGIRQTLSHQAGVKVLAEESHIVELREELGDAAEGLELESINTPPRRSRGYSRLIRECLCVRSAMRRIRSLNDVQGVLFLSGTPQTIIALRLFGRRLRARHVTLVLHSVVETLVSRKRSKAFWEAPLSLRAALRFGPGPGVRFAVFSNRIHAAVCALGIPALRDAIWTEIPCWPQPRREREQLVSSADPVRIGAIGVGHRAKGTNLLFRLAKTLRNVHQVRLALVGFVKDRALSLSSAQGIEILSIGRPLDSKEMRRAIELLDYSLFLFPATEYVLTETASFSDAVSAAKPAIALESPLMLAKFKQFGNIGYIGKTIKDIEEIIRRIAAGDVADEYAIQQSAMIKAAGLLSPEACARRLLADTLPFGEDEG
jgi:hypothetical protein